MSEGGLCAWEARIVKGGVGRRHKVPDQESAKKAIPDSSGKANHVEVNAALSEQARSDADVRPWCGCCCSASCDSKADSFKYEIPSG